MVTRTKPKVKKKARKKATIKEKAAAAMSQRKGSSEEFKKKLGRPTKYKPEYCEHLQEHLSLGLSFEIFGACLPDYDEESGFVAKSTVEEWVIKHPEFAGAKKNGMQVCQAFYEKKGVKHITHRKDGEQLNTVAWIFNMKNRFGWTDKKEVSLSESTQRNLSLSFNCEEDPAELDKRGGDEVE